MLRQSALALFCLASLALSADLCDDYNPEYPYYFDVPLQDYPAIAANGFTGNVRVRVNQDKTKVQFNYHLDQAITGTAYDPIFAMHLHSGALRLGEGGLGGPVVIDIAGHGDVYGTIDAGAPGTPTICSDSCQGAGRSQGCLPVANCVFPLDFPLIKAMYCPGGCNGDARGGNNAIAPTALAPSRTCPVAWDAPFGSPPQNTWIQGTYSDERSGNSSDATYSPYSIFRWGNEKHMCSPYLPGLLNGFLTNEPSYIAVHLNYNATAFASLTYGDVFGVFNDGTGVTLKSYNCKTVRASADCSGSGTGANTGTVINFNFEGLFRGSAPQ